MVRGVREEDIEEWAIVQMTETLTISLTVSPSLSKRDEFSLNLNGLDTISSPSTSLDTVIHSHSAGGQNGTSCVRQELEICTISILKLRQHLFRLQRHQLVLCVLHNHRDSTLQR